MVWMVSAREGVDHDNDDDGDDDDGGVDGVDGVDGNCLGRCVCYIQPRRNKLTINTQGPQSEWQQSVCPCSVPVGWHDHHSHLRRHLHLPGPSSPYSSSSIVMTYVQLQLHHLHFV